jgi:hypothetical protein
MASNVHKTVSLGLDVKTQTARLMRWLKCAVCITGRYILSPEKCKVQLKRHVPRPVTLDTGGDHLAPTSVTRYQHLDSIQSAHFKPRHWVF